uniref:Putative LRR receptor-like serine/threonine-protein kinase At2g24230 n=1 Tax=Rhizophora mucronata TaxID=61149 RepID=A0A2P2P3J8_RHIMU
MLQNAATIPLHVARSILCNSIESHQAECFKGGGGLRAKPPPNKTTAL